MIAKMKCSNCGAEMSNLNLTWGKKQLWFIIPAMVLGFLPLMKIMWFKRDATKDLIISEVQKRTNGRSLEIVGLITNRGKHKFSSVTIEAEFFDAAGNFLDEANEYLRSDISQRQASTGDEMPAPGASQPETHGDAGTLLETGKVAKAAPVALSPTNGSRNGNGALADGVTLSR